MKTDIFLWKKESARGNIRKNATKRGQSKRKRTNLRRKTKGRCPRYRSVKSKWERWCWNRTAGIEKQKAITEKPKDKIKKQAYTSKQNKLFFSPYPTPFKNTSRLSLQTSPLFATSSLVSLKSFLPRHQLPFNPTRRTRAYAYIRACALSEFAIFAFTLHISPQQTVDQSLECEGNPCIHLHLHLHRNNLIYNTLHDFHCKKTVKTKGWSLHPQLTLAQHLTPKRWRGEGKNRKTLDARACA